MAFEVGSGGSGVLDPSGFQISVAIVDANGIRIPLWMRNGASPSANQLITEALTTLDNSLGLSGGGGTADGLDLTKYDLPIVESVSLELSLGLVAKTTINVAAPYELGLKLMESALFKTGNVYEVQLSYPRLGRQTPWFSSTAQKPSIRINADEGLTGTLNGDGGGIASARALQKGGSWEGKSYREIIEEIAERHGWIVKFKEASDIIGQALESLAAVGIGGGGGLTADPLEQTRGKVSQGLLKDWFFVQKLARSAKCDAFMAPDQEEHKNVLYIKKRKDVLSEPPRYKFMMRGNVDFMTVFPMLEFETEAEGAWLPGAAIKATSSDIDPLLKIPLNVEATAETTDEATLGDGGVPDSAEKNIEGVKVQLANTGGDDRTGEHVPASARDPRTPQEIVQAHRDESAFRGGINANISSFGIPDLFPGSVVELAGVGIFNSNYWIQSLAHNASGSEWLMTMKLVNNGGASGGFDAFLAKESAKTNTEKTEEGVEAGSGGSTVVGAERGGV